MAYWKENINVEVLMPFDTPNCTTSWYWVTIPIDSDMVHYYHGVWMCNVGDYATNAPVRINLCGKAVMKNLHYDPEERRDVCDIDYTAHHLMACRAYSDLDDPRTSKAEHFRVRLVSRDKQLSDSDRRSMRLHSIDYGSYIYKPQKK